jgi:hypothetical protein
MQIYNNKDNQHILNNNFIIAFDEFNDIRRKLFDIPEIDKFLFFTDKKNIYIQNQSQKGSNFLNCIIAKICIDYHISEKKNNEGKTRKKKTILIDAGNGNNIGCIYLELVNQAIKKEVDLDNILDRIIIARAFTFYQLANILIHQLPKMTREIGNQLQIIIVDLLDTLVSSSPINKMKDCRENDYSPSYNALQENVNIINQMIDVLISLSVKYFVILTCDDCENIIDISIGSKFSNAVKIKHFPDKNKNEKNTFKIELLPHNRRSRNNIIVKQLAPLS